MCDISNNLRDYYSRVCSLSQGSAITLSAIDIGESQYFHQLGYVPTFLHKVHFVKLLP